MKRIILIIIAVIMVLASSGCKNKDDKYDVNEVKSTGNITETDGVEVKTSDNEAQNTEKSIDIADASSNVQSKNPEEETQQEPINSLNDLNKKFRSLKIQKSGDTGEYEASNSLRYIICDMLSKVEPVYLDTPEGKKTAETFNYNYYDYLLKFEGAKDILFVREGNALHFEGEKQIYYLWGSADSLWDSLIFDTEKKSVDIEAEKIRLMSNVFKEDLDGDGNAEDIELFYERGKKLNLHGSLYISINDSKVLIMEDDWYTMPYRIVGEMPKVRFLKEKNGNSKAVLVIYSWATNGVGSTGELYAYKFTDGQISEVTVKEPEKIMTYSGNDILSIKYPELNRYFDLRVDPILFKQVHGTEENSEKHPIINDIISFHTLWYIVNDFNGDAIEDLCRVSIPYKTPIDYCYEYIYYEYEKGELRPVQVIYAPTYGEDKKNALLVYIYSLINANGYFSIEENGIVNQEMQLNYEYTYEEIIETLEELQKEKILTIKGDRAYINY